MAPGCNGLVALPHLGGSMAPDVNAKAKGVFYGFTLQHTRAHFARAIMESIGYIIQRNIEAIENAGLSVNELRSLGGGSKSPLWNQIKADIIRKPLITVRCQEAACLGAAITAGVAVGIFSSIESACESMVEENARYMPNEENAEVYEVAYEDYKYLFSDLCRLFERTYRGLRRGVPEPGGCWWHKEETMTNMKKVEAWLDKNSDAAVRLLRDMVAIPSVNSFFDTPEELKTEGNFQRFVAENLKALGAEVELTYPDAKRLAKYEGYPGYAADHTFENRPNVYANIPGAGGGRSILLAGHADTVAPGEGWTVDPFKGAVRDGRIYGRGIADQKGGIAASMVAVQALKACGIALRGDVRFGSMVDEEAGGMGMLDFIDRGYRADACLMTEPTDKKIAPLCRGILWGKIIIKGRSGHIELPHGNWRENEAVDGIQKARYIMDCIENLNRDWAVRKTHPLLTIPCSIEFGMINGGEFPSTFANKVEIGFDAQFLPRERDDKGRRRDRDEGDRRLYRERCQNRPVARGKSAEGGMAGASGLWGDPC